jgi:hypothetical protein
LHTERIGASIAALTLAALAILSLPGDVQAGGRVAVGVGFYAPLYPLHGPYPYSPYYGNPPRRLELARERGMGALELHVKPGKAEVFVDGRLAGKAGDFDGSPTLLWLKKGTHQIRVSLEGYETFTGDYHLAAGEIFEVHLKMKK